MSTNRAGHRRGRRAARPPPEHPSNDPFPFHSYRWPEIRSRLGPVDRSGRPWRTLAVSAIMATPPVSRGFSPRVSAGPCSGRAPRRGRGRLRPAPDRSPLQPAQRQGRRHPAYARGRLGGPTGPARTPTEDRRWAGLCEEDCVVLGRRFRHLDGCTAEAREAFREPRGRSCHRAALRCGGSQCPPQPCPQQIAENSTEPRSLFAASNSAATLGLSTVPLLTPEPNGLDRVTRIIEH